MQPMAETAPANAVANHDAQPAGADFHWGPWVTRSAGVAANGYISRVQAALSTQAWLKL
jgi:hypothetical protein